MKTILLALAITFSVPMISATSSTTATVQAQGGILCRIISRVVARRVNSRLRTKARERVTNDVLNRLQPQTQMPGKVVETIQTTYIPVETTTTTVTTKRDWVGTVSAVKISVFEPLPEPLPPVRTVRQDCPS